jgi:hypothetical protein
VDYVRVRNPVPDVRRQKKTPPTIRFAIEILLLQTIDLPVVGDQDVLIPSS